MKYTTQHIQALYGVSHTTVKNWCSEFAAYLSPSATPEQGRARQFTQEDLEVLGLVAELKNRSATYDMIHAALKMGQRASLPESFNTALAPTGNIVNQLEILQRESTAKDLLIRQLEIESGGKDLQINLLKEQLAEARKEIGLLQREIGRLSDHDT